MSLDNNLNIKLSKFYIVQENVLLVAKSFKIPSICTTSVLLDCCWNVNPAYCDICAYGELLITHTRITGSTGFNCTLRVFAIVFICYISHVCVFSALLFSNNNV